MTPLVLTINLIQQVSIVLHLSDLNHGIGILLQDSWKTTMLLRVKEKLKAKELEEDDLT